MRTSENLECLPTVEPEPRGVYRGEGIARDLLHPCFMAITCRVHFCASSQRLGSSISDPAAQGAPPKHYDIIYAQQSGEGP